MEPSLVQLCPDKVCDHAGRHEVISDCCSIPMTGWWRETDMCPGCKNHTIPVAICADCGEDVA